MQKACKLVNCREIERKNDKVKFSQGLYKNDYVEQVFVYFLIQLLITVRNLQSAKRHRLAHTNTLRNLQIS